MSSPGVIAAYLRGKANQAAWSRKGLHTLGINSWSNNIVMHPNSWWDICWNQQPSSCQQLPPVSLMALLLSAHFLPWYSRHLPLWNKNVHMVTKPRISQFLVFVPSFSETCSVLQMLRFLTKLMSIRIQRRHLDAHLPPVRLSSWPSGKHLPFSNNWTI